MSADWSAICSAAVNRPLQQQLAALYATSGITVTCPVNLLHKLTCSCVLPAPQQIAAFCAAAVGSGVMLVRWLRAGEGRAQVWRLYGHFVSLMFCGSCAGAAAWSCNLRSLSLNFVANNAIMTNSTTIAPSQVQRMYGVSNRMQSAFLVFYSLEFLCLSVAKLFVLDRLLSFAAPSESNVLQRRLAVAERVVVRVIVAGSSAGVCSNIVAAVYSSRVADYNDDAAAAFDSSDIQQSLMYQALAMEKNKIAEEITSIQQFCEVAVLIIIVLAFVAAGLLCARRIAYAIGSLSHAPTKVSQAVDAAGNDMRQRIIGTVAVVFATFVLRAIFSSMNAISASLQNSGVNCSGLCSAPCHNTYFLIQAFLSYTPEFQQLVILISEPLSLAVALWAMTNQRARQLLSSGRRGANLLESYSGFSIRSTGGAASLQP